MQIGASSRCSRKDGLPSGAQREGGAFALRTEARRHSPVPRRWEAGLVAAREASPLAA